MQLAAIKVPSTGELTPVTNCHVTECYVAMKKTVYDVADHGKALTRARQTATQRSAAVVPFLIAMPKSPTRNYLRLRGLLLAHGLRAQ